MAIGRISFGRIIAVSGKESKVKKLNQRLSDQTRKGNVIIRDVTQRYKNAPPSGVMAQAAQNGEKVSIYITGADVDKFKNKEYPMNSIDGLLIAMTAYYNINGISTKDAFRTVLKN